MHVSTLMLRMALGGEVYGNRNAMMLYLAIKVKSRKNS